MSDVNLAFVETEQLVEEFRKRHEAFFVVFMKRREGERHAYSYHFHGNPIVVLGLANFGLEVVRGSVIQGREPIDGRDI